MSTTPPDAKAPEISTKIPVDLHPSTLEPLHADLVTDTTSPGNDVYRTTWYSLERTYAAFQNFDQAEADLKIAPAAVAEYEKAVERVWNTTSSHLDRSMGIIKGAQETLEKKIATAISHPDAKGTLGSEIRSVVRSLPADERGAFVLKAARSGDVATVAAILAGPPILSGLTDADLSLARSTVAQAVAPQEHRQLEASRKAQERLMATGQKALARYQRALALAKSPLAAAGKRLASTGR
jgi:hypothetical protein